MKIKRWCNFFLPIGQSKEFDYNGFVQYLKDKVGNKEVKFFIDDQNISYYYEDDMTPAEEEKMKEQEKKRIVYYTNQLRVIKSNLGTNFQKIIDEIKDENPTNKPS